MHADQDTISLTLGPVPPLPDRVSVRLVSRSDSVQCLTVRLVDDATMFRKVGLLDIDLAATACAPELFGGLAC
jgi:hypothetical protein